MIPSEDKLESLVSLYHQARYKEMEHQARDMANGFPDCGVVWQALGTALYLQGRIAESIAPLREALRLQPNDADTHNTLGIVLQTHARYAEAEASYRTVLEYRPGHIGAHNNLGIVLSAQGKHPEAAMCFRTVLALMPDYAEAWNNLGICLYEQRLFTEAGEAYHQALRIRPGYAEAYSNLGNALKTEGQVNEAIGCYMRAVEHQQDYAEAYYNLGVVLAEQGRYIEAEHHYRQALVHDPQHTDALLNLGNTLRDQGRLNEAEDCYRRTLQIRPGLVTGYSNLLFALNYMPDYPVEYCLEAVARYRRLLLAKTPIPFSSWHCAPEPSRLRVGIVSGDLRDHPVGYFLEGLIAHIDRDQIELVAYPADVRADDLTSRIRPFFTDWRPLDGMDDATAARLIHADGIHLLLDLSGHTDKNRLPVFAWKPAPVQVTWLGYFATTGVPGMDYLLADPAGVPENCRDRFSETIWYLPDTRLCFTPPTDNLPVSDLPAFKKGFITFGCFQNLAKVNDRVLNCWSKIFAAVPNAQLHWQCKQFADPVLQEQFTRKMTAYGIEPQRVHLRGPVSRPAYLTAHAEIDMILDTFPYPGGTTTCESLWMGVPTLTLAGNTMLARQGAGLLQTAGLDEWIVYSEEEYVLKACTLSANLPRLAILRHTLRGSIPASPLCDAIRFARNFEAALWGMWQHQCSNRVP